MKKTTQWYPWANTPCCFPQSKKEQRTTPNETPAVLTMAEAAAAGAMQHSWVRAGKTQPVEVPGESRSLSPWSEGWYEAVALVQSGHANAASASRTRETAARAAPARPFRSRPVEQKPPPFAAVCRQNPSAGGRGAPSRGRAAARRVASSSRDERGRAPFSRSPLPGPVLRRGGRRARARARATPLPPPRLYSGTWPLPGTWHCVITWPGNGTRGGGPRGRGSEGGGCVRDGAGCEDGGRGGRAGER